MTADALPISSPDLDDLDDLLAWRTAFVTVFAMPATSREETEAARDTYRDQRLTGVKADGRWVATFRSWGGDSAVPGPALTHAGLDVPVPDEPPAARTVTTELVSSVSVSPTHRRQGLLSRLMADCLRYAADRGVAVASLFASEAAIYGRYGYGVATTVHDVSVDTRAAAAWHAAAPGDPGRVRLSDDDELASVGPDLFEAARLRMPGAVGRNAISWMRLLERMPPSKGPDGPRVRAVHLAPDGSVDGYVRLRTEMAWVDGAPRYTATVDDLTGASPAVVAALWRFCLGMDLVSTVKAEHRGQGELLGLLPVDTRAARVTAEADGHWWRVLDVPAALASRSWCRAGRVVLEVVDPGGPAAGRWSLDVDGTGEAEVARTTATADVTLPVQTLPAVLTGLRDLPPLLAVGRLDEHTAGATGRLHAMARVAPVALAPVQGF